MPKISLQTKSFIVLLSAAILGVLLCLTMWADLTFSGAPYLHGLPIYKFTMGMNAQEAQFPALLAVDTSNWPAYSNKQLGVNFKYKPDWKVLPATEKGGFNIIQVDPGQRFYNIKIYVSPKEFYVMDGLPATNEVIGGAPALNVHNALYGIKANGLYYTFDVGLSMSLLPDFNGLVHSVQFTSPQ